MAKTESFKTTRVVLIYPKLHKPDQYGDSKPSYKTKFKFEKQEDADKLRTWLKAKAKETMKDSKTHKFPWKVDEETGEVQFGATSQYKPLVCDSRNHELPANIVVNGGTIARLELGLNPNVSGPQKGRLALYLNVVQVIKLEEYVREARKSTFDEVEDGYESDDPNEGMQPGDGEVEDFGPSDEAGDQPF